MPSEIVEELHGRMAATGHLDVALTVNDYTLLRQTALAMGLLGRRHRRDPGVGVGGTACIAGTGAIPACPAEEVYEHKGLSFK